MQRCTDLLGVAVASSAGKTTNHIRQNAVFTAGLRLKEEGLVVVVEEDVVVLMRRRWWWSRGWW